MSPVLRIAAVGMLVVGTGCAERTLWDRPGATEADYRRDVYECERDARMATASFGSGLFAMIEAQNFMRRCMTDAKGWREVRADGTPVNRSLIDQAVIAAAAGVTVFCQ